MTALPDLCSGSYLHAYQLGSSSTVHAHLAGVIMVPCIDFMLKSYNNLHFNEP